MSLELLLLLVIASAALFVVPAIWKPAVRWLIPAALLLCLGLWFHPVPQCLQIGSLIVPIAIGVTVFLSWNPPPASRLVIGAISTLIVSGVAVILHVSDLPADSGHPLVASYPLISMAPRLKYETLRQITPPVDGLPGPVVERLREQDRGFEGRSNRQAFLYCLHSANYRRFRDSPGFGVTRMGTLTPDKLDLPPLLAPLPGPPAELSSYPALAAAAPSLEPADLETLHRASRESFLFPAAFGYVRDRDHVAGFERHAVRTGPPLSGVLDSLTGHVPWTLVRLELVSLLRFETPRVYQTSEFPDMAKLPSAPTRPLNSFESASLPRLSRDDVVIQDDAAESPASIRMLGALRASQTCLRCHEVPKGTLLGAFSYVFSGAPSRNPDIVQ